MKSDFDLWLLLVLEAQCNTICAPWEPNIHRHVLESEIKKAGGPFGYKKFTLASPLSISISATKTMYQDLSHVATTYPPCVVVTLGSSPCLKG